MESMTRGPQRSLQVAIAALAPAGVFALLATSIDLDGRVALGVALGAASLLSALATPASSWLVLTTVWSAAALGTAMQIRLGQHDPMQAGLLVLGAGVLFAGTSIVVRALEPRLNPLSALWIMVSCAAVSLSLRLLPGLVPGGNLANGKFPLLGLSIQIGEFTRLGVIIAAAFAPEALGLLKQPWASTHERVAAIAGAALIPLHLVVLLIIDSGPALVTALGCLAVCVAASSSGNRPRRSLVLTAAGATAALVAVQLMLANGVLDGMASRVQARLNDLDNPGYQLSLALAAMADAGVIGGGLGSSDLVEWVPAGRSDYIIAVLGAELGIVVVGAVVIALLAAHRQVLLRLDGKEPLTLAGAGLVLASAAQLLWTALGAFGVAPLTGVSAPWLAATGSTLLSASITFGLALGIAGSVSDPRPNGFTEAVRVGSTLVALTVALVLVTPTSTGGVAALRYERGDLLTRDGQVMATGAGPTRDHTQGDRTYPDGSLYASLTGRSWGAQGAVGLERHVVGTITCGSRPWWSAFTSALSRWRCEPASVVTTIDPGWQKAAQSALEGRRGAAVVLDAATGEVLVSYDSALGDPNRWQEEDVSKLSWLSSWEATAPGSAFKPLVAAVALEEGISSDDTPVSELVVGPTTIRNAGRRPCNDRSYEGALEQSCNTVYGAISMKLGAEKLADGLSRYFGVDRQLNFDGGPAQHIVTGLDGDLDQPGLARTGIGQQDVRATPLALATALSYLVAASNQTAPATTHVLAGTCQADGFSPAGTTTADVEPISKPIADRVLDGMRRVIYGAHGTMRKLRDPARKAGVDVRGKSGTAAVSPKDSTTGTAYWATAIVNDRFVAVIQVRDTKGANTATQAMARLLPALAVSPVVPTCPS